MFRLYVYIADGMPKRKRLKNRWWGSDFTGLAENFWLFLNCPTPTRKCLLYHAHTRTTIHARTRTYSSLFLPRVNDMTSNKPTNTTQVNNSMTTLPRLCRTYVDFMTTFLGNIPAITIHYKDLCRNVNVNPI